MTIDYKFDEDKYIAEFAKYIDKTYNGHYSTNKFQSTEVIIDRGHGTGFCMGNVDKYSNRYGKKGTQEDARKDLMKILHYALIQLYVHDNDLWSVIKLQNLSPQILCAFSSGWACGPNLYPFCFAQL